MKKITLLLFFIAGLFYSNYAQQPQQVQVRCIAFYNLENLFDTIVDPDTNLILQDDFTPFSARNWNTEKYYKKLDNMARVISEIGTELEPMGPAVLGCAEVENETVMKDLASRPALLARNYQIVHFDSPDERGIDVGFFYRPDAFTLTKAWVRHEFTLPHNDKTRDLLIMEGTLDGEHMYFMVDHWPSRSGGEKRSRPLRDSVAKHDRVIIDSILKIDPNAKIIYMGDLNDDPTNESVLTFLKAKGKIKKLKDGDLYNPFFIKYKKGNGTLAYNDAWNLFDNIVMTQSLLSDDHSTYKFSKALIFKKPYMFQADGRFKGYPLRTFVGKTFMDGYSDHFPVYIFLTKDK